MIPPLCPGELFLYRKAVRQDGSNSICPKLSTTQRVEKIALHLQTTAHQKTSACNALFRFTPCLERTQTLPTHSKSILPVFILIMPPVLDSFLPLVQKYILRCRFSDGFQFSHMDPPFPLLSYGGRMRNSAIHFTSSKISVLRKFLAIFTPAALLVLFGLFLVYRYEIESHISLIKQKEINAVEMGEELIHNSISPVIEDLLFLTNITNKLLGKYGENTVQQNVQLLEQNYLSFAGSHPLYDQIRLLDQHGWERIRVNYSPNGPILVARGKLQDKHQRYYFEDAFRLDATQIFISPLDLNIEHGQIESPLKPMIRFGKVIVNPSGDKLGVVLLNYKAKAMLEALKHWGHRQNGGNLMLLNREGYWLAGKPEQEWGFMFSDRSTESLDQQEPELWASTIKSHEHGQVIHPNGIYTYATVHPLRGDFVSSTGSATATGDSKQILMAS